MSNKYTVNNKLIVEAYKSTDIKKTVINGLALPAQNKNIIKLKLLLDAMLKDGSILKKGSCVYVPEDYVFTIVKANGNAIKLCNDLLDDEFLVIDYDQVVAVGKNE